MTPGDVQGLAGSSARGPLVSVVLPVRNREDVVAEALLSVLQQSYTNLEVIVVDDASTDRSLSEVRRVADPRVTVVQNDGVHSASGARNIGVERASGRYLAFQDSDDWWHPEKLAVQMHVLLDPGNTSLVVVGSHWRLMQPGVRLRAESATTACTRYARDAVLSGCLTGVVGTPMLLVDRDRAASVPRFDVDFPSLEERDFVYQCLPPDDEPLAIMDSVLVDVRRGRKDHVANPAGSLVGYERMLSKYAVELAARSDVVDWYHYRAMREALILRDGVRAASHRTAIDRRSPLLEAEYVLGRWFGYRGLAAAARAHLRPGFDARCR